MSSYHSTPFPSPDDWRDHWIYSLLIDRFNNPQAPPRSSPWDGAQTSSRAAPSTASEQLPYLQGLGVGATLLSPIQKNCQCDPHAYHGYGPQNFLAVEPRFASEPAAGLAGPTLAECRLHDLIAEAHARGIYVLLDLVLNHVGDVFDYVGFGALAPWRSHPYPIRWRDETGRARAEWSEAPVGAHLDAAVQPVELRSNSCFVRQGHAHKLGDFFAFRKLDTRSQVVRNVLTQIHKDVIARYDVDGFRIDALNHLDEDFAKRFARDIRAYALGNGKKNFFILGEVSDSDSEIARFIGPEASADGVLDYPLFYILTRILKGFAPPVDLVRLFERRKDLHHGIPVVSVTRAVCL